MGYYSSRLLEVWGTSSASVYAAGILKSEGAGLPAFVIHYDGTTWTKIMDDSLNWWIGAGILTSIHGLSDTTLFVAGSSFDSYATRSFVGKWDGRRWKNISPHDSAALLSVWAKSDSEIYVGSDYGAILRYDGTSWRRLESGTNLDIWQITGSPTGELYGVASDYFNSFAGSMVLRIEGNTVTLDQFFPVGQKFGIWGIANGEAYATGEGTFHKLNSSSLWQEIPTPNPGVAMWSVTGTGPNNVLVVGAYGAVMHWSGKSWKFYDELYNRSSAKSYFKAFAIGNKYFLVGTTPSEALITVGTRSYP